MKHVIQIDDEVKATIVFRPPTKAERETFDREKMLILAALRGKDKADVDLLIKTEEGMSRLLNEAGERLIVRVTMDGNPEWLEDESISPVEIITTYFSDAVHDLAKGFYFGGSKAVPPEEARKLAQDFLGMKTSEIESVKN